MAEPTLLLSIAMIRTGFHFLCFEVYFSDGADGMAAEEWSVEVHQAAVAFRKILF
jgi:adenosylhomocysteine nucleosidase